MRVGSATWRLFREIGFHFNEIYFKHFFQKSWTIEYDYEEWMAILKMKEKHAKRQAFKRLQEQKYIKATKKGGKILIELMDRGKHEKLKNEILGKKKKLTKGKICVVSFDIPEAVREVRREVRVLLKGAGFKQFHRSVWEGDRDVIHELRILIKKLKAEDWVRVYIADKPE